MSKSTKCIYFILFAGQGMYGPGISNNNGYNMQPYSYEWGGNGLGNQAAELKYKIYY